jgi:hypothetical protein
MHTTQQRDAGKSQVCCKEMYTAVSTSRLPKLSFQLVDTKLYGTAAAVSICCNEYAIAVLARYNLVCSNVSNATVNCVAVNDGSFIDTVAHLV